MVDNSISDQDLVQELLNTVSSHQDWDIQTNSRNLDQIIDSFFETGCMQITYKHTDTTGTLHTVISTYDADSVLTGILNQTLDIDMPSEPNPGYLTQELVDTYQSLVTDQDSEYISTVDSANDILAIDSSSEYESSEVEAALSQASWVSKEVQEMHDEIINTVRDYRL